jgi:phosphodiesterase/alkaline phosphatase D-like protein
MRALSVILFFVLSIPGWSQTPAGAIKVTAGPVAQSVTDTQATICWDTNQPAATIVKYGLAPNHLTDTAQQPWGDQRHAVQIDSLKPATTYYFALLRGSGEVLKTGQFRTLPSGFQKTQPVWIDLPPEP